MTWTTRRCSRCGAQFTWWHRTGRPRSKCDSCRSNLGKIDGAAWRQLRIRVLAEQPTCAVIGCGRLATEVDHIRPLKFSPELALDRSNLQGMCKTHNASKGARTAKADGLDRPACSCGDPACPGRWHF